MNFLRFWFIDWIGLADGVRGLARGNDVSRGLLPSSIAASRLRRWHIRKQNQVLAQWTQVRLHCRRIGLFAYSIKLSQRRNSLPEGHVNWPKALKDKETSSNSSKSGPRVADLRKS
jgi:hypothetical protein